MRAGLGEGVIACSRGGRHLFWFRGVCATAASSRCLAGRSDRGRPPLFPWNRGDGGRPQRVSSEARPARPSHTFRVPARRDIARAREAGQEAVPQGDTAGDGHCCATGVDDQKPARPAAAVVAFHSDFGAATRPQGLRRSYLLVSTSRDLKAVSHGLQTPLLAAKDAEKHRYLAQ